MPFFKPQLGKVFFKQTTSGQNVISQKKKKKNFEQGRSKSINIGRESLDVSFQAQDQSNREPINEARS